MASSGRTIWPSLRPSGKSVNHSRGSCSFGVLADILRRGLDGFRESRLQGSTHFHANAGALEAVELARVFEQRRVATLAHGSENRRDDALGFFQAHGLTLDERAAHLWL